MRTPSTTFAGAIAGAGGSLVKAGAGELVLPQQLFLLGNNHGCRRNTSRQWFALGHDQHSSLRGCCLAWNWQPDGQRDDVFLWNGSGLAGRGGVRVRRAVRWRNAFDWRSEPDRRRQIEDRDQPDERQHGTGSHQWQYNPDGWHSVAGNSDRHVRRRVHHPE